MMNLPQWATLRRALLAVACLLLAPAAFAQPRDVGVTEGERAHASMMILLLVVGGVLLSYVLLWILRARGILPEEKPLPRPRWVHPLDEKNGGGGDEAG